MMDHLAGILLAGLWESIFSGFFPFLLVLIGVVGILVGALSVYQTHKWPKKERTPKATKKEVARPERPPTEAAPQETGTFRPTTTTKALQVRFPQIDAAHPDVWSTDEPLEVEVRVDPRQHPPSSALTIRLHVHRPGSTTEIGNVALDAAGSARMHIPFDARGERDVVAELISDGRDIGQAVRAVRIVDYRDEVVETFEDFVAWAAGHYPFVDRKMTAREFVDRYADGRPGTPTGPLDAIVDLYELANYSDHPVDRRAYLSMVDAFLELEEAGALEGPEDQ